MKSQLLPLSISGRPALHSWLSPQAVLGLRNLLHNKPRTAAAVAGVAFAVILVFMQLGFLGATRKTATLIYDALEFDIVLRSPSYAHLCDARTFPRNRVLQAASLEGVDKARCFYVGLNEWQHPESGVNREIIVMGVDPNDSVFRDAEIRRQAADLGAPEFLLIDRKSKAEYGPANGVRFGPADRGVRTSLGGRRVQITGCFELGTGFAANGAVLTSHIGYCRVCPYQTLEDVNLGLLTVRDKSAIPAVKRRIERMFEPYGDVDVLTRREVEASEVNCWVNETSIGAVFQFGVLVALVVGVALVYQVLASDVAHLLNEYATLKAMGYRDAYLGRVVLQQAVVLAVLGFCAGLAVSWALYARVASRAGAPIEMTAGRVAGVFVLSVVMCCVSGLGAARKLRTADPADLF